MSDAFDLAALHLLRPHWLWALLALPLLAWMSRARRQRASIWRTAVDAHLLPHLLEVRGDARMRWAGALATVAYIVAVVALAGPSWRQLPQPLWQTRAPLVIAVDMSSATMAGDLPPSRLAQARAKLSTLLRERAGGQVGLVAFAGDAFTVAPLTEDAANVALFLDALAPDVMPVDGQRVDRGIAVSARLLRQAGFDRGTIVLMADQADAAARTAASDALRAGYRVSVIGLGSAQGAPYRRVDGTIATSRLDSGSLRRLASAGGGSYAQIATDDSDLRALGVLDASDRDDANLAQGKSGRAWKDEGFWLLPPLMLLALFAFRRRAATAVVLVACLGMPWTPAQAAQWWQRADQTAHAQMSDGAQAYRGGDFARAAQLYRRLDSADAHYNRGNALAKAGQYPQAIDAYDEALKRQPGMADALANKRAVEAAMKRKPPSNSNAGPSQPQDKSNAGKPSQGQGEQPKDQAGKAPKPAPGTGEQSPDSKQPPKPADAQAQQAADAAQRERMQQALKQQPGQAQGERRRAEPVNETPQQREQRLANEAWLRRVPDDPGGLLREKFRIEYEKRLSQGGSE